MSAITLQFATEASLGSWAIRVYSRGRASHVDTVMPDGRLLGARYRGGVAIREPDYARFSWSKRIELPATDSVASAYAAFLEAQLGKPYDLDAIAAFTLDRDWRRPDTWFCSEIVCAGLEASGFVPKLATPANRVTPEMLLFLCSAFASPPR